MKANNLLKSLAAASVALMVGCATNHQPINMEAASSEVAANGMPVKSIAVFVITEDQEGRAEFEDSFSAAMSEAGINANATYSKLPGVAGLENNEAIANMYKQTGADSGLTIEMIEEQNKTAVKATKASGVAFWTALILDQPEIADIASVTNLAAYDEARRYKLRLTLWDAKDHSKIWSMETQSFTTFGVISKDAKVLAELVSEELRKNNLAAPLV